MKRSDYTERGFAGLHIKKETRQRLNLAKAHMQAQSQEFISQDKFINLLLNNFEATTAAMQLEPQQ